MENSSMDSMEEEITDESDVGTGSYIIRRSNLQKHEECKFCSSLAILRTSFTKWNIRGLMMSPGTVTCGQCNGGSIGSDQKPAGGTSWTPNGIEWEDDRQPSES